MLGSHINVAYAGRPALDPPIIVAPCGLKKVICKCGVKTCEPVTMSSVHLNTSAKARSANKELCQQGAVP